MSARRASLIAVDGTSHARIIAAARALQKERARGRRGISRWDASGLFEQLVMAEEEAGEPSARTLLLLYAADLAFRLRWEIQPAIAEGRTVIAAPYIDTAIAFGRATGLSGGWLASLFQFAPRPDECRIVAGGVIVPASKPRGFVELGCGCLGGRALGLSARELAARTRTHLVGRADRSRARRSR